MVATSLVTAEEHLAPQREERGVELIGGVLVVDEPTLPHELIRSELLTELRLWTRAGPDRGLAIDTRAETILAFRRRASAGTAFDIAQELVQGEQLTSPLLPDFAMPVEALFA